MDNLQDLLINKRNELKLSLRNAAELIGISHSYLSTLEKGIDPRNNMPIKPTPDTLQLISKAYEIPYSKLMKLAGYLEEPEDSTPKLTEKDERDIEKECRELRKQYAENSALFSLSGEPLSPEAMESIIQALEFGIRQAKLLNKKYIPKKYRK